MVGGFFDFAVIIGAPAAACRLCRQCLAEKPPIRGQAGGKVLPMFVVCPDGGLASFLQAFCRKIKIEKVAMNCLKIRQIVVSLHPNMY